MKIETVEFVGSFGFSEGFPRDPRPEIAFFGRSNVGKSTLINALLGRRRIARTSKTPGKTRGANYFRINQRFLFVDMPGYGYAKVSKREKEQLKAILRSYLEDRPTARGVVQLMDIRREPAAEDREMVEALKRSGRRMCLVFTKTDKLKGSAIVQRIAESLGILDVAREMAVIPFSGVTGVGKRELWGWIDETLSI